MPETPKKIHDKVEIAIVIGGGNIFRVLLASNGMDRAAGTIWGMFGHRSGMMPALKTKEC
jgi:uridylate kinase